VLSSTRKGQTFTIKCVAGQKAAEQTPCGLEIEGNGQLGFV